MARLRLNNVGDGAGSTNPITISSATAGSCSWPAPPANMPIFSAPDYLVVVCEPGTANEEIIWITGYGGGTSAPILRNPELGSGSQVAHSGTAWVHGPTAFDFKSPASRTLGAQMFR